MRWRNFILAAVVLGVGAFLWATYRSLAGTTHSGQAPTVGDVPFVGTSLDWLRPRGPVAYEMYEHIRGPYGFVSGEASADVPPAARAAGFRVLSAGPDVTGDFARHLRECVDDPSRFTTEFGEDDELYLGTAPDWGTVQVFYRKKDCRFTAWFIRSNDGER